MPIFLVVSLKDDTTKLDERVRKDFGEADNEQSSYQLQGNAGWLIDFKGTTQELSKKLGITDQTKDKNEKFKIGPAIVVPVSNYWGLGSADMWAWLKLKME